jgi:hypothetical protein
MPYSFIFWCLVMFVFFRALTMGNPVNLILTKATRRVWMVSRGCLLIHDTGSNLHVCYGLFRHTFDFVCTVFGLWSCLTLTISLYDKRDDFDFAIVNIPFLCNSILILPAYGVCIFQLSMFFVRGLFKTRQPTYKKVSVAGL